jgi:hypothetical protein
LSTFTPESKYNSDKIPNMTNRADNADLTIVCIATDRYLEFWIDLVLSLQTSKQDVNWVLFTDRASEIPPSLLSMLDERLRIVFQKHLPWPYPTLLRYKWISEHSKLFESEFTMYLDSDMRFIRELDPNELLEELKTHDFIAVKHPGFYRPGLKFYFSYPGNLVKDIRLLMREGGLGTWEKRRDSKAFVPRKRRRQYVCGGCWFGRTEVFIKKVKQLSAMVGLDLEKNLVARFHDESYLNALVAADSGIGLASPKFCFDPNYVQLNEISGLILAVDKNTSSKWER